MSGSSSVQVPSKSGPCYRRTVHYSRTDRSWDPRETRCYRGRTIEKVSSITSPKYYTYFRRYLFRWDRRGVDVTPRYNGIRWVGPTNLTTGETSTSDTTSVSLYSDTWEVGGLSTITSLRVRRTRATRATPGRSRCPSGVLGLLMDLFEGLTRKVHGWYQNPVTHGYIPERLHYHQLHFQVQEVLDTFPPVGVTVSCPSHTTVREATFGV